MGMEHGIVLQNKIYHLYRLNLSQSSERIMAGTGKKGNSKEGEMSFLEHLEELRWHIIRSLIAIVSMMIIAFIFKNILFDKVVLAPKDPTFII